MTRPVLAALAGADGAMARPVTATARPAKLASPRRARGFLVAWGPSGVWGGGGGVPRGGPAGGGAPDGRGYLLCLTLIVVVVDDCFVMSSPRYRTWTTFLPVPRNSSSRTVAWPFLSVAP